MQPGGNSSNGLKASDVDPRLVFHHGVPSGATKFTCDNIHNILALSTKYVHSFHLYNTYHFFYVHVWIKLLQLYIFLNLCLILIFYFYFEVMGGLNYLVKIMLKSYLNLISWCLASFYRLYFIYPFQIPLVFDICKMWFPWYKVYVFLINNTVVFNMHAQFIQNQGILINVTSNNHIEVSIYMHMNMFKFVIHSNVSIAFHCY